MISNKKKFLLQSFKSYQALQLWYKIYLYPWLFENFKYLNIKIREFKTNTWDSKQPFKIKTLTIANLYSLRP
jgi:hypothetical protein